MYYCLLSKATSHYKGTIQYHQSHASTGATADAYFRSLSFDFMMSLEAMCTPATSLFAFLQFAFACKREINVPGDSDLTISKPPAQLPSSGPVPSTFDLR